MEFQYFNIDCPLGMEYEPCHKGCPQTCVSLKNSTTDLFCSQIETDGCFCPEGKVLKDDACVDEILCETCDEEGHVPGDWWDESRCKRCHCRQDLNIECVQEKCPETPICSLRETLVQTDPNSCCGGYVCVPMLKKCPKPEIPKCDPGEVAKSQNDHNNCPAITCECDPQLCAPFSMPQELEIGQEAIISEDSCCPVVSVVCLEENCPEAPDCKDGLELTAIDGVCCTTYKCKPPKDVCAYSHTYQLVDGLQIVVEQIDADFTLYKPGEQWQDGLCEKCTCKETNGQLMSECTVEQCISVQDMPENKDYVLQEVEIPDKCCPDIFKVQCLDNDGNGYMPGEQWQDEDDPCITYLCQQDGSDVIKTKSVINCTECSRTAVLFPPSRALGQCCGVCKTTKCEEEESLYKIGETWISKHDKCRTAECISEFGKVYTVYTRQPCPTMPKDCPNDKVVWDQKGCCKICNLTSEISCSSAPIPEDETVGFFKYRDSSQGGMCINDEPVSKLLQCKGACHSESYYSLDDGDFKDNCKCCKINITVSRAIRLLCPNGNYIKKTFLQPETCHCSKCAPISGASKKNHGNSPSRFETSFNSKKHDYEIVQKPSAIGRFTEQNEEDSIGDWQNQVQKEDEGSYNNYENEVQQKEESLDNWRHQVQQEEEPLGSRGNKVQQEEESFDNWQNQDQEKDNDYSNKLYRDEEKHKEKDFNNPIHIWQDQVQQPEEDDNF